MKHVFSNPLASDQTGVEALAYESTVRLYIGRVAALVDELDAAAKAISSSSPATARHLRLISQQMAAMALTALETWPKVLR